MNIRPATPADAKIIAQQRGEMFMDMAESGDVRQHRQWVDQQLEIWTDWLRQAIPAGDYVGLLAEIDSQIVGSLGLMFRTKMPSAKDPTLVQAYILNVYVLPDYRRQGIAEALLRAAFAEAQERGIRALSLNTSPFGKGIYERLGFTTVGHPEMRLTLDDNT